MTKMLKMGKFKSLFYVWSTFSMNHEGSEIYSTGNSSNSYCRNYPRCIWVLVIVLISIIFIVSSRGVAHRQQLRQYDAEKAEDNLSTKKTQRDDMIAQKVIALT